MARLTLGGHRELIDVELRADEYISAELTLLPRARGEHIVITVHGVVGGWMELVVDRESGAVEQATLTDPLPPISTPGRRPQLDLVPAGPCLEVDQLVPAAKKMGIDLKLDITRPLGEFVREGARVCVLGGGDVTVAYSAHGLSFGFDDSRELVEIEISNDLIRQATPF